MNKYGVVVIILALLGVVWIIEIRYDAITSIPLEYRYRRLTPICKELNDRFNKEPSLKYVHALLGQKAPIDIEVEGYVAEQSHLTMLLKLLEPYQRKVSIRVNVQVDPAISKMPSELP
jgi:hypothetical protein